MTKFAQMRTFVNKYPCAIRAQIQNMASTKFFLDCRRLNKDNTAPLKIAIRNRNTTVFISSGISLHPDQWDSNVGKVKSNHPMHQPINALLTRRKAEIDVEILALAGSGQLRGLTAAALRDRVLSILHPDEMPDNRHTLKSAFEEFMSLKKTSTRGVYRQTLSRINAFTDIDDLDFENITPKWLSRFDEYLARTAPSKNARNIHFRNIRAVFNYALDNEYTTYYPFRRFKIRPEATRKRSLTVEELRTFINMGVEPYQRFYKDMFILTFYLIGINAVDLSRLTEITHDGRIRYVRAKTHRKYSIKVEPEALEIINKYRGNNGLLCISDRWSDHRNFIHQLNNALKNMGDVERVGRGGKKIRRPMFPELSSYWARHTWATIAYNECGISEDVIGQALGHSGGHTVTDIYIDKGQRLVDEANRRVLDWVLYGKK